MPVDPPELDQDDADEVANAQAEVEARAKAFQSWWSGPFGDNFRVIHPKTSDKATAKDAFTAGWAAVVNALDAFPYDDHEAQLEAQDAYLVERVNAEISDDDPLND